MSNADHLIEKQLNSETIYEGKVITLTVQTVELPNGKQAKREVVLHPGAVTVLAITADDQILLVNQFRKAPNSLLIETPAGKLERGEDPLTSAKRELEEETGYQAAEWKHITSFYTSPGFADELIHCYVATGLTMVEQKLDEDEFLDVLHVTAEAAEQMILDGRIADAKTVALVYWWLRERMREGK
ncbi:NUDIX domain-containing protein [Tumebacillus permanentifrigoris]|uniref:ADP-ribose pyrophosphatase n=1 Tax=Tumebacillus permanentifrigoris TaxID=378543 RepID=A0A316DBY0_9BACL|nr:NUDIX hydrolase [Tumebacillus permanentifrigoris]PWK14520.1 ADP-ribose pyrophosphatase [Tumebacillus permanentifrigoris]